MPLAIYEKLISIEWKTPPASNHGAVYRIWFGKMYYIGRTREIKRRKVCHQGDINRRLNGKLPNCDPQLDYYRNLIDYLKAHPKIKKGTLEILLVSDNDNKLVAAEQEWFDKTIKDKHCLNLGRIANPYKAERKPKPERKSSRSKHIIVVKKVKPKITLTNKQKIRALKRLINRIEKENK